MASLPLTRICLVCQNRQSSCTKWVAIKNVEWFRCRITLKNLKIRLKRVWSTAMTNVLCSEKYIEENRDELSFVSRMIVYKSKITVTDDSVTFELPEEIMDLAQSEKVQKELALSASNEHEGKKIKILLDYHSTNHKTK